MGMCISNYLYTVASVNTFTKIKLYNYTYHICTQSQLIIIVHSIILCSYIFRTAVPQLPASPIFSLQINPLPDLSIILENPIMMMFDVVSYSNFIMHIAAMCICIVNYVYCVS